MNKVKLSLVHNVETGEWIVKVYANGVYKEEPTYYTDDKADAIATAKLMAQQCAAQTNTVVELVGINQ